MEIVSWLWAFGDGATSAEQNPAHTYTSVGFYYGSLMVTSDAGDTDTKYFVIKVFDSSSGMEYQWDFGDGTAIVNQQSVSHQYTARGIYFAVLTMRDTRTGEAQVLPVRITVWPSDIEKAYWSSVRGRLWLFGDGYQSSEENPQHTYYMPGVYSPRLIVWDEAAGEAIVLERLNYITVYGWSTTPGGLNVSRTNRCLRVGLKPGQGGIQEITGDDWPMPEARTGTILVYDPNGQAHALVLDAADGLFYEISTEDTPYGSKVWKDKVATDGTGGTDYEPEVHFAPDSGNMEHHRVRLAETHLYTRNVSDDDRSATGFDANGYPTGMTAEMTFYKDGEPTTETAKAEDIALPKGEIRTDREIEGNRIETRVKFNMGKVQLIGREQYFVAGDVPDNPDDRMMTEDDYQEELAEPALWLSRGSYLTDRATGNTVAGAVTLIEGPDGNSDSAMRITTTVNLTNSAQAAGTFLIWRKSGYTISGVSLTDVDTSGTWILSYLAGAIPANINLTAGDVFDVRIYSTTISAKCRTYLFNNVDQHDGDNVLPPY